MSDSFKKFQEDFEVFANTQAAELAAVRTIFQSFLVSMFANHPQGTKLLNDLRADALATLSVQSPEEGSDQGRARLRELTKNQAERFFDELRGIFPGLQTTSKTSN
jgi:hypothetical protein